jgi:glycosyltransferase involved in cell wall biosynthesis
MRIGIDASNLRDGGGLTHMIELLCAAKPEEHGIDRVVLWGGRDILGQIPDRPWLERVHEPMLDRALPARLYWQKLRLAQLARDRCDCLWVPGGSYGGSFKPFVTMSRNLLPFEGPERKRFGASWMGLKMLLLKRSQARSFRNAETVIFLTEYAREVVGQSARLSRPRDQQPIIPHGVNRRFYLPPRDQRALRAYSLQNPFRFLYVSKVEPYKHQWQVAEAVAMLRHTGIPVALDLIGGSACPRSTRRLLKTIERVDPRKNFVQYMNHVPYSKLTSYYHRADAFIFASSCENMPNILLEAMASGLPIACAQRGPMPEVLGAAGRYFDPERPEEIAAALRALLDDPKLRARCANLAFERARQYSWERCAQETFSALAEVTRRVIGNSGRPVLSKAAAATSQEIGQ